MPPPDDLGAHAADKGTDLYDLQSLPASPAAHAPCPKPVPSQVRIASPPPGTSDKLSQIPSFRAEEKFSLLPFTGCKAATSTLGLAWCIPAHPQRWTMPGGFGRTEDVSRIALCGICHFSTTQVMCMDLNRHI